MKTRLSALGIAVMLTLGGCAYLQTITNSEQFKVFCGWSPVAITAIQAAVTESATDPSKQIATEAMGNALLFLKLAAAQCPVVPAP